MDHYQTPFYTDYQSAPSRLYNLPLDGATRHDLSVGGATTCHELSLGGATRYEDYMPMNKSPSVISFLCEQIEAQNKVISVNY